MLDPYWGSEQVVAYGSTSTCCPLFQGLFGLESHLAVKTRAVTQQRQGSRRMPAAAGGGGRRGGGSNSSQTNAAFSAAATARAAYADHDREMELVAVRRQPG